MEEIIYLFCNFLFHFNGPAVEKTISVLCLLNLEQHFMKIFRVSVVQFMQQELTTTETVNCQVQAEYKLF